MDNERLGIYGAITVASIIINFIRITLFYLICINASRVLHNRMFGAIIRAPIRFFDSNSSGTYMYVVSKCRGSTLITTFKFIFKKLLYKNFVVVVVDVCIVCGYC